MSKSISEFCSSLPQTYVLAFALVAAVVAADSPAPYQPAPAYKEEPAQYQYSWKVQDDYAKLNYGQDEERNGYATSGSYRVALPDGRTQIVTYTVSDAYSGYVADVRYEGEARYEPAPAYKPAPKPAYKPAPTPAYRPAPTYSA